MRRQVIGPRGGVHEAEVSCFTCVCDPYTCAYSSTLARAMRVGCDDWVSPERERIAPVTPIEREPDIITGPELEAAIVADLPPEIVEVQDQPAADPVL